MRCALSAARDGSTERILYFRPFVGENANRLFVPCSKNSHVQPDMGVYLLGGEIGVILWDIFCKEITQSVCFSLIL